MKPIMIEGKKKKVFFSEGYNFVYNKDNGFFARWGKTKEDDPECSPFGPELVDMELSTVCHGINGVICPFCYKSNTSRGENMSLDTFRKVFEKIPKTVGQIAFGIGSIDANEEMFDIFQHCRDNGVVPNVTINGDRMTDFHVKELARLCGAVAVSRYEPKDVCYDAVKRLYDAGLKQINIHKLLAAETYDECVDTINDVATDPRLKGLKAIVFLALKQKGRGKSMTPMQDVGKYHALVELAADKGVGVGFDSCSCARFLKAMEGHERYKEFEMFAEPCESTLFSLFIDVKGVAHPCSFTDDGGGVDVANCDDFLEDVWFSEELGGFRSKLLETANNNCMVKGCRECPVFDV